MSFVIEGKDSLYLEDIVDVLGHEHHEEAEETFAALDRDGNGDISLDEMILCVTDIGRDRKSIASSMHDVDQAITVLDRMLMAVCFIAVVFIFVAFLNKSFVTTLATAGTALLSLSFVFSVTAQEFLGSCIFLFVKHPYDIGDRVDINNDQLVVDHISLLFTIFRRVSGEHCGRFVQIPNIVLNTLWIENVSRSKAMTEQLSIMISFDTTFEDIQLLKNEMLNFVQDKENCRDFQSELEIDVLGTSDMSKLELRIEIRHKSNWHNETIRAARRSKFMCALVQALRRVPINGPGGGKDALGSAANASYSVAIPDDLAKKNAEESAKQKEAGRLLNKKLDNAAAGGTSSVEADKPLLGLSSGQERAVDDLTNRSGAYDAARDEAWTSSRETSSTLGELPSIDRQDLEEVRGMLRRQSTKGRRKVNGTDSMMARPNVPTIAEPQPMMANIDQAQQAQAFDDVDSYERYRVQAAGASRRPPNTTMMIGQSQYATPNEMPYDPVPYSQEAPATGRSTEMRPVQSNVSNDYRHRAASLSRRPVGSSSSSQPGPAREYEEV